jgi:ethanolamine-phosphate cytidylyltransferase
MNRYKVFKRTEGVSTTEIIGRLLMLSRDTSFNQQKKSNALADGENANSEVLTTNNLLKKTEEELFTKGPVVSSFLTTGWRLQEFCNNRFPKDTDRVVYIDGTFDILHIGLIEALRKAKELGDYLFVGVYDDATTNKYKGKNYPILNLQERVLNLLAMKYVDDVVIGAPWIVSEDIVKSLKINMVVQGTELNYDDSIGIDPYTVPKKLGIYQEIKSEYDLTNDILIQRLIDRRENYVKKYQNKSKKEKDYYKNKEYIQEL